MRRRHWILIATIALLALVILFASRGVSAADAELGRKLYETHCDGCHDQSVHGRTRRVAQDFEAVRAWVARWNAALGLRWGAEEIDDVAVHLNSTYYRYPCPPSACPAVSGHAPSRASRPTRREERS